MIITAGMGTIDDFFTLVNAGAEEIFCGFIPKDINAKYGNVLPINRREVLFYHVQITTYEDMKILYKMASERDIKVSVTFNALFYTREQLEDIGDIIERLIEIGFKDFIVADINLISFLSDRNISCNIHVSGEIGEWNSFAIKLLLNEFDNEKTAVTRIIFHRKNTIPGMEKCIKTAKLYKPSLEFEAFCMNEKCHYTGGFCNSLHCDEMVHLCKLEYRLPGMEIPYGEDSEEDYVPGRTGCALCKLDELEKIGITHLKIVGRGLSADEVSRDIYAVKNRLNYKEMCNKNCYYIS